MPAALSALRPRLFYGIFAAAALALSLRLTFPSEAVRERLIYEAGARGLEVEVKSVHPHSLLGVSMDGVALTDASGLKVPVEHVEAKLEVLPLLLGRRVVKVKAEVYDGTIEGSAALFSAERRWAFSAEGVNLSRALPIRRALSMDLSGAASGSLDLTLPGGSLEKASGTVELRVLRAALGGGQVPIPPLPGTLTLPPIALGTASASAKVEGGRVTIDKLETRGGDVELTGEGIAAVLQPRLEYAPLAGQARVRPAPSLWQKPAAAALRPVLETALPRAPDGSYRFQLSGTLGHPQLRPLPAGAPGASSPPPPPPPPPPGGSD